jgi:hypothetical protein
VCSVPQWRMYIGSMLKMKATNPNDDVTNDDCKLHVAGRVKLFVKKTVIKCV